MGKYVVRSGGIKPAKGSKTFNFDIKHNLLTQIAVTNNFKLTVKGNKVIITVPANLATTSWVPIMSVPIQIKLNYMYYLTSPDYNGYGRLGIASKTSNAIANDTIGKLAYGEFPMELDSYPLRDGETHIIRKECHEGWFYIPSTSSTPPYQQTTENFVLWFCGDHNPNGTRDSFSFTLELYEQIKYKESDDYIQDDALLKKIINDPITNNINIQLTTKKNNVLNNTDYQLYNYKYETKDIQKTAIITTEKEGKKVSQIKSWTVPVIDKIYDSAGKCIMEAIYNQQDSTKIDYYRDFYGNLLYLEGGII